MPYGLTFISDEDLFNHVKSTVEKYRAVICLKDFHKNIIDPIKLTFDARIYKQTWDEVIESEIIRQLDKSNNNHIGYFHQDIFKYIDGWLVPVKGFDIINSSEKIYVEMKNKHNTMNSSSSQKTYMRMQDQLIDDAQSVCMLVEVIAKRSQNIPWKISLNGNNKSRDSIRRVSIDQFYKLATGRDDAFYRLCQVLPQVIDDVLEQTGLDNIIQNTVIKELMNNKTDTDVLRSIYQTSFATYEGFTDFKWR